jgi:hypothetical protein
MFTHSPYWNRRTMNNEHLNHKGVEFEREDLSAGGIFAFLVGLAVVGLLMHLILAGMYRYLDVYEKTHQTLPSPMARPAAADMRQAAPQEADKFPTPRLEINERAQLNDKRLREEETLNTYGWVDQKAGMAHIPIDRAMDLIAQQGLPTAPGNTSARPARAQKVPTRGRQAVRELRPTPTTQR